MADNYKLHIGDEKTNKTINYGKFEVQFPKNYTNNSAFIGQHKLTSPESTNVDNGGSAASDWNKNNAGKLMSCFEINWGNAIEGWRSDDDHNNTSEKAQDANWDDDYTFPDRINTSADLLRYIFMLRWKLENLKLEPDVFKVTVSGLTASASLVSGKVDLNNITWSIKANSSTNYSEVKLSTLTGNIVTGNIVTGNAVILQGTPGTISTKGIVGINSITLGTSVSGSEDISATFTRSTATRQLKATVNIGAPAGSTCQTSSLITLQNTTETIYGLSESTDGWTWTITGTGASKCGFGTVGTTIVNDTTKSQTLTWQNSNGEQITIKAYNTNGNEATKTITLPKQQTVYYWYVGKDESKIGKSGQSYNLNLSNLPTITSINSIYSNSQFVGNEDNNIYVVCPTSWVGQFKLTDLDNNEIPQTDKTSQITSGVTGYSILRGNGKVMDSTIKVVKI